MPRSWCASYYFNTSKTVTAEVAERSTLGFLILIFSLTLRTLLGNNVDENNC